MQASIVNNMITDNGLAGGTNAGGIHSEVDNPWGSKQYLSIKGNTFSGNATQAVEVFGGTGGAPATVGLRLTANNSDGNYTLDNVTNGTGIFNVEEWRGLPCTAHSKTPAPAWSSCSEHGQFQLSSPRTACRCSPERKRLAGHLRSAPDGVESQIEGWKGGGFPRPHPFKGGLSDVRDDPPAALPENRRRLGGEPPSAPRPCSAGDAPAKKRTLHKAIMYGTIGYKGSVLEKFQAVKAAGFEGVEPMSHMDQDEVVKAFEETGLKAASVCCNTHWDKPLSHPDDRVRQRRPGRLCNGRSRTPSATAPLRCCSCPASSTRKFPTTTASSVPSREIKKRRTDGRGAGRQNRHRERLEQLHHQARTGHGVPRRHRQPAWSAGTSTSATSFATASRKSGFRCWASAS